MVRVIDSRNGKHIVLAEIDITERQEFNTAFIANLEPGEAGFERGIVGGIAQEIRR